MSGGLESRRAFAFASERPPLPFMTSGQVRDIGGQREPADDGFAA